MLQRSIWIGYDPREETGFRVAHYSLVKHLSEPIPVHKLVLGDLQARGLYTRPTERRDGRLIDLLSARADYDGSISTEHANARFLVPHLARTGWALFSDCDVMTLADVAELFALADPTKALMCVHHDYRPAETVKMDGQVQTVYPRKNQSSVMLFNCDHPANRALTLELINTVPGRDLHQFCWLDDSEIGELPPEWNHLVGVSQIKVKPKIVHFTRGLPDMPGYENQEYADAWRSLAQRAAAAL